MDDTAWSTYTLGLVETLCEDGAVAASATWDTDMLGNKIPPKVVKVTIKFDVVVDVIISN